MKTESVPSGPAGPALVPPGSGIPTPARLPPGLTGGQRSIIAGLLVLQVPWGLILFPLAAIFAITGIFVPVALVLVGIGTLPWSYAMRCRNRWRRGSFPVDPGE